MQLMHASIRIIFIIVGLVLLQSCHHKGVIKPNNQNQLADLKEIEEYQFNGKMSFSDGQEGGSGSIQWQSNGGLINVRLKAPLGSKSWRLIEQVNGAEMIADGETLFSNTAQTLLSNQLGWQLPWQQLKSWVIGQLYDSKDGQVIWHQDGFTLIENGWQIEYSRLKPYTSGSLQQMPHKMVARNNEYSIKLSVKQWEW